MDDIGDQLRAWADATAPIGAGEPVRVEALTSAPERTSGGAPGEGPIDGLAPPPAPASKSGARRWLAVAAVVAVLAVAAGAAVRALGVDDRAAVGSGDTTAPSTAPAPDPATGPVGFEVLHLGGAGEAQMGTVQVAATDAQLAALWDDLVGLPLPPEASGPYGPEDTDVLAAGPPDVDLDQQVVVAITIPDDACAPELVRFDRDGSAVTPVFEEVTDECEQPLIPKRYVVALDRAGIDRLRLPADETYDLPATEVLLRPGRTGSVVVDLEQPELAGTVAGGGTLPMTVVVSNNTGRPLEMAYCGAPFAVGLENDEVDQQLGFNACLQQSQLAPGITTFEVEASASYGSCVAVSPGEPQPEGMVACGPGGSVPPLPPGEYRTRLYPPGGLGAAEGVELDVAELDITVTDP
jgi:hypothetical protein